MSPTDREAQRRRIIDAVIDITTHGGLQAATFRTVAQRAGVSVRLVQYYFGTKDELLEAVQLAVGADVVASVGAGLAALGEGPAPRAVVDAVFEAFMPYDEPRRRAMLVFVAFRTAALTDPSLASSQGHGHSRALVATVEEQIEAALAAGLSSAAVDARSEAYVLVSTMTGLAQELLVGQLTETGARRHLTYALDRALPRARTAARTSSSTL